MNTSASGQRRARDRSATFEPSGKAATSGTRQALLDAARACVRDHGVANTTSRLIAAAAGANLGAITYYFGGKDELLAEALLGDLVERFEPVMERLRVDDAPAATRLLHAVQALVAEFERSADEVPVYLNALMLTTQDGPLAARGRALLGEVADQLAEAIAGLQADGTIAAWVRPDAMASLLIAAGNGIALQTQLDPGGASVSQLAGQLSGLLLAASVGPAAPTTPRDGAGEADPTGNQ